MAPNGDSKDERRKLGTFGGVFVPNVLTILGVIMFMRTGWVVGNAGLLGALQILLIAKCITLLTSLSLASISTNTKVGAGGAYFLISRSLGLEVGGSIGLPLYFAQAISVAFYLVGFTESLQLLVPDIDPRLVSTIALVVFVGVAWFGASIVAKAQYVILVLLVASLVAIFTGVDFAPGFGERIASDYEGDETLWTAFAIFFPAVTGIMAGVSMSGDLKSPSRSIPFGTIAAILVTMVIYACLMIWLALSADRDALRSNNMILLEVASVPSLIYVGLWAATLSSALASLAAAPRTLQALAHDRVIPRIFSRSLASWAPREPHVALLLTGVLAAVCIMLGDLNLIAPIISMFFLATYGTLNFVAGIERIVHNPSYRPTFRTHWMLSILGGVACVSVMFLIHAPATLAAAFIIVTVYIVLSKRSVEAAWGDMRSGMWFAITRFGLLRFVASRQHVRNWRPVILVLVGNPKARLEMIEFAQGLESKRGFLFLAQIVTGPWEDLLPRQRKLQDSLRSFIRDHNLSAAPKTIIADNFEHGVATLLQATGIGEFEPNTVMVGWNDDVMKREGFAGAIRRILETERNLVVFASADDPLETLDRVVDVWWYARENGSFMVTLAYLLQSEPAWQDYKIRVLRVIQDEAGVAEATTGTRDTISELRIDADVQIIVSNSPPLDVIAETSERSAVCFIGLAISSVDSDGDPLARYSTVIGRLKGNVFLSKSWQDLKY